jgi:Uma2 family endonuclease
MHMANRVQKIWTREELHSLPDDGNKYELIHGELFVTPTPTVSHETVLARLTRILDPYVVRNDLGFVFHRGAIITGDDSEVGPDLMVRQPPEDPSAGWASPPMPILVVEVASDSTRRRDRMHKRNIYAEAGIPEYWMVDGRDRTVRIARLGHADVMATESLSWHPVGGNAPLAIALVDVFGPPAAAAASSSE